MTAIIGCKLKQNANDGCNSCATVVQVLHAGLVLCFIACFILLVIAPLDLGAYLGFSDVGRITWNALHRHLPDPFYSTSQGRIVAAVAVAG